VAIATDGRHAYVAIPSSNSISVIDTQTNKVGAKVSVGSYPLGIAVAPDGKRIYVINAVSNNVSMIDAASNAVVATVALAPGGTPGQLYGIAVTPDGNRVYVTNSNARACPK
jgi:YVTN family beta-propeller protein